MTELTELDRNVHILGLQVKSILVLGGTFLFWLLFELLFPGFFTFPRWVITEDIWASVTQFWPLFAWGGLMALVSCLGIVDFIRAGKTLATGSLTSGLAGVWEEVGYRGIFIFMGMLALLFSNWTFKLIILGGLIVLAIAAFSIMKQAILRILGALFFLAGALR
ncbi:MAG: hypothetical protein HY520_03875 [Candidatus Aenigmarchaeota archaeon]|nr:hypothetical protein [Candidatus Aenigmarchaeota archaeon]